MNEAPLSSFCSYSPDESRCSTPQTKQNYTWQELTQIERQRRAILRRTELPFWKILSFWSGTCLKALTSDILLWLTVIIYSIIRVQAHFGDVLPGFVRDVGNSTDIDVIGGFLSFFLVLFVNQSNSRFNDMYKCSAASGGRIQDVASLADISFPRFAALRIIRYMNAAHAAGYVGLSKTYSKQSFFDPLNDKYKLLTPAEASRLMKKFDMDTGIESFNELTEWALQEVQAAQKNGWVDSREGGVLKDKILSFRASIGTLYDYTDQPLHFFYLHFLCLLSAFYLPLFAVDGAYGAGAGNDAHWAADLLNLLIVVLQAIFVIGLRLLGQRMIDPYGDDLEDLSVLHYIEETWTLSHQLLSSPSEQETKQETSPEEEEQLFRQSKSLEDDNRRLNQYPESSRSWEKHTPLSAEMKIV